MGTYPPNFHFTTASIPQNRWMKPKNFPSHQEHRCLALDSEITKAQLLYEIGMSREKAAGESLIQIPRPQSDPIERKRFPAFKSWDWIFYSILVRQVELFSPYSTASSKKIVVCEWKSKGGPPCWDKHSYHGGGGGGDTPWSLSRNKMQKYYMSEYFFK